MDQPRRALDGYRASSGRVRTSWRLFLLSIAAYPPSAAWCWWYRGHFDPFEQLMLVFSVGALAYSGYVGINAAEAATSGNGDCPHCQNGGTPKGGE